MGKMPTDLSRVFATSAPTKAKWQELTPDGRRDMSQWVGAGKESEVRAMRVQKVRVLLAAGKKLPKV